MSTTTTQARTHTFIFTPTISWVLGKLMFSRSSIKASQQSGLIWLCSLIKPKNPRPNKAIYAGGVRDKSSGMNWMSWINTWLHSSINRPKSKSMLRCHIAVPWAQSAYQTKSHDPVPVCSAVWEGGAYRFWNHVGVVCWRTLPAGRFHAASRFLGDGETRLSAQHTCTQTRVS